MFVEDVGAELGDEFAAPPRSIMSRVGAKGVQEIERPDVTLGQIPDLREVFPSPANGQLLPQIKMVEIDEEESGSTGADLSRGIAVPARKETLCREDVLRRKIVRIEPFFVNRPYESAHTFRDEPTLGRSHTIDRGIPPTREEEFVKRLRAADPLRHELRFAHEAEAPNLPQRDDARSGNSSNPERMPGGVRAKESVSLDEGAQALAHRISPSLHAHASTRAIGLRDGSARRRLDELAARVVRADVPERFRVPLSAVVESLAAAGDDLEHRRANETPFRSTADPLAPTREQRSVESREGALDRHSGPEESADPVRFEERARALSRDADPEMVKELDDAASPERTRDSRKEATRMEIDEVELSPRFVEEQIPRVEIAVPRAAIVESPYRPTRRLENTPLSLAELRAREERALKPPLPRGFAFVDDRANRQRADEELEKQPLLEIAPSVSHPDG